MRIGIVYASDRDREREKVFGVEACWRDDDDEDEIYRYCVWC